MGRTAEDKLREADLLHGHAVRVRKSDPGSADALEAAARRKRASAIKQLRRRPKRRGPGGTSRNQPREEPGQDIDLGGKDIDLGT